MARGSFAWDVARNLTVKCSLFCTKFILKHLYLAENSLYKKPLFLIEPARGPVLPILLIQEGQFSVTSMSTMYWAQLFKANDVVS